MIDLQSILAPTFWEDPGCLIASEWEGEMPDLSETESSVIFRTSGSSGEGKWIVLSKRALHVSALRVNEWLAVCSESVWGLALPLRHVGGFGIAARAHAAGCGVEEFPGKWEPVRFTEWIVEKGITHTSLVPTQVHDLISTGCEGPECLVAVVVGGGRLDEQTGQAARQAGWPVLASYGMTECCSQIATQRLELLDLPYEAAPMEILPGWNASVSPKNLLLLEGECLLSGTIEHRDGQWIFLKREPGAYATSDRVKLSHGTILPLVRADSLIKIMGELVNIEAIERRFLRLAAGGIEEAKFAIVPLPDPRNEHQLIAVFENGAGDIEKALADYHANTPGLEKISRSITVDCFPRSPLGKLRRHALAEIVR